MRHLQRLNFEKGPIQIKRALVPNPEWVKTLSNRKLPDRRDFMTHDRDLMGRVKV